MGTPPCFHTSTHRTPSRHTTCPVVPCSRFHLSSTSTHLVLPLSIFIPFPCVNHITFLLALALISTPVAHPLRIITLSIPQCLLPAHWTSTGRTSQSRSYLTCLGPI